MSDFVRVFSAAYAKSPLGFSFGPSRFSPLPGNPSPFGVLYLAENLATGAYETIVRDRFDMIPSRTLLPADYAGRVADNVGTKRETSLDLLDLTDGNAVRWGVPTDVIKNTGHVDGQYFSEFVYANVSGADGLLYQSRLTEGLCVGVYDRAVSKLSASVGGPFSVTRSLLSAALTSWRINVR